MAHLPTHVQQVSCGVSGSLSTPKRAAFPGKLAEADPETAYIGISYALRPMQSDRPRFVTCCSQVFDAEGSGLEFIAYDTKGG